MTTTTAGGREGRPSMSPGGREGRPTLSLARLFRRRRRLRATGPGRALIGITFAVGFAAFNTGNNLLFFGWGLLLSSIVISGILSEATLRAVIVELLVPGELRARASSTLPVSLSNTRRTPSFAVLVRLAVRDRSEELEARAFTLRLDAHTRRTVDTRFHPRRRGPHEIRTLRVSTAFPFGFFEKDKVVDLDHPWSFTVLPARVDVSAVTRELLARMGESPARLVGLGDELFSLRPFRAGDDPRKVAWRRAARTGRLVVRETEAQRARDIVIDLALAGAVDADVEHALAVAGSVAEDLIAAGHAVGLRAPGAAIAPTGGPRQRSAVLHALALLDVHAPMPLTPSRYAVVLSVVARGALAPIDAGSVVDAATVPFTPISPPLIDHDAGNA